MNEEDSEQMSLYLEEMGFTPASRPEVADVVLLNTCSVRRKPEEKAYSKLGVLREIKLERPDMIIGVCGCMAQVESAEIRRRAPYVDLVVGTSNIAAIPNLVREALRKRNSTERSQQGGSGPTAALETETSGTPNHNPPARLHEPQSRLHKPQSRLHKPPLVALSLPTRKGVVVTDVPLRNILRKPKLKAHVPVMYGCDKFCTFCIVPLTRGRERSRPTAEILQEIEGLARGGTKEVTLLGQTVNSYGKNMAEGRVPFARLLELISDIRGIRRIRFTSPYPRDFSDELIEAIAAQQKVCRHVHLPLQAADDALLSRMRRGYTTDRYREIVEKLRSKVPGIAITTDIMLGFPGETLEQVNSTMQFVEETRFDSAFMFIYSPRPGTKAAVMEDQVPQDVKVERLSHLIALQNRITVEINRAQVGQVTEVLVEGRSPKDRERLTGLTTQNKTVNFTVPAGGTRAMDSLVGKLVPVRLEEAGLTGFVGTYEEPQG